MAREFERHRNQIIDAVADWMKDADDARAVSQTRYLCRKHEVPATAQQIGDMATEAIRRRMIDKIKQLDDRVVILRDQLIALNDKVNGFHP